MSIDVEQFRAKVIEAIDMTREPSNDELHEIIDSTIKNNSDYKYMPIQDRYKLHKDIFDSIRGLGIIEELINDNDITEIMVNGIDSIYIEKKGRIKKIEGRFVSENRLNDVIQQIVGKNNRRVNESNPIVDTRLEDGSRVNVVMKPIAIDGPIMTIRKFPKEKIGMNDLIKWNSINREAADFLEKLVKAGYNIFISGGTGSGKTTFLNVLSNYIPVDERVVTIEDSAELQLSTGGNIVRMESRQANSEGNNEISLRALIKTSLRMRPDRIIVGEVRGEEALDMLQAMNTGHDGSMSTGHANSPKDMLSRLETMVITGIDMPLNAVRAQIVSAIDIIVHLGRLRDKSRKVLEIDEVTGYEDGNILMKQLYVFKEEPQNQEKVEGSLVRMNGLDNIDKLIRSGMYDEYSVL